MTKKGELCGGVISRTNYAIILIASTLATLQGLNAVEINGKLIHAVGFVESNNNPNAIGDSGAANGSFQMHRPAWSDCSAWLKSQGFKATPYDQGVNNPAVSHYYCKIYLSLLHRQLARALNREISAGDLYAAYNLGFAGYKRRGFDLSKCPSITQRAVAKLNRKLGE